MKTCYLHLGMPKTGSTSIQNSFYGFDSPELRYAKFKAKSHGVPVSTYFTHDPAALRNFRQRELSTWRLKRKVFLFRRAFEKAANSRKSIILSGEGILDLLKPDEVADLISYLNDRFDRVVPLIYVRPLASLVSSQFQQSVKTGLGEFNFPAPGYKRRFGPVVDCVGRDGITFIRFDRQDLIGGDVVKDFTHRVGLEHPPKIVNEENQSLSAEAVGAIYGFNKYTGWLLRPKRRTQLLGELESSLYDVGERKFGFSEDLIGQHIERHKSDIRWMEDIGGFDVHGRIKTVPDPIGSEGELLDAAAGLCLEKRRQFSRKSPAGKKA